MNVASLELCKELYELSGWSDTSSWHIGDSGSIRGYWEEISDIPAYDLGYLLRKLPSLIALPFIEGIGGFIFIDRKKYKNGVSWRAGYHNQLLVKADTPEDAAAKLCCELIRQEVLKP